jgi:hypothetical protein
MTMGRLILAAAGVAALAGLGGCSGSEPEPPTNNVEQAAPAPQAAAPKPVVTPPAENATEPVAVPAEKPVAADQQMMEDASATGMTSHVSRDEQPADSPAN